MADDIQRQDRGNVTILSIPVRLDAVLSETFDRIRRELVAERRFRVVMDCERLKFVNSVVIEILLSFHQQATDNGGDLKFANVSSYVDDIFRLSNLDQVFLSYSSVDEAVNAF